MTEGNERRILATRTERADVSEPNIPTGPFFPARIEELAPAIDVAAFREGAAGRVVALDAGETALPRPRIRQIRPAEPPFFDLVEIDPAEVTVQRPLGMPDQGPGMLDRVRHPALTIARLRDVICVPGGIVLAGDRLLAESFNALWQDTRHAHMTRDNAGDWHLRARPEAEAPVSARLAGPMFWLDHQNEASFGHFMLDMMSRAWAVEYGRAFLGLDRIRSLCSWPAPEFAPKLIEAAGVPLRDIVFFDRPVHCEELIVATKALQIQEYTTPVAARLWQRMADRLAPPDAPVRAERIYVSRRTNPTRALVEEEGVETLFKRFGFVVIYPDKIDIADQVKLFAGARLIAGCSGSNLAHLGFARNARAVLVLASPLLVHYTEQMLLSARPGVAIDLVLGFVEKAERILKPGYVHAEWHLDLLMLEEVIAAWVAAHG